MVKYELLMQDISKRIRSGLWSEGMLMPTENELCKLYSVSRITVRRALDELERQGEILRVQGKGTFIRRKPLASGAGTRGFKKAMEDQGIELTSTILEKELVSAPQYVRENLVFTTEDTSVWRFVRLRKSKDTPIAYMETYVTRELGDEMLKHELENASFYALYEEIFGTSVMDTAGFITAINATGKIADSLGLQENEAAILFKSIAYIESEKPVQLDFSYFNPKSYQFSYNLEKKHLSKT